MNEKELEQEIQSKNLNAPRLTPEHINSVITDEAYYVFTGTQLTVCCLTLKNGFTVTGSSACASPSNFDEEIGRKLARDDARNKIWQLEGYLLKERLANYSTISPEKIARVAHEVNRAYCQSLGDNSQLPWDDAPEWQRSSAINGVNFHLNNPNAGPDHSHNEWLKEKKETGWKYGHVKDVEAKEHPCFVPYDELPTEQKSKDYLFRGIVHALSNI